MWFRACSRVKKSYQGIEKGKGQWSADYILQ